ncbi:hypothetical protein K8T06_07455 [bacterium]|nr:hypothetical protein [bacterium]
MFLERKRMPLDNGVARKRLRDLLWMSIADASRDPDDWYACINASPPDYTIPIGVWDYWIIDCLLQRIVKANDSTLFGYVDKLPNLRNLGTGYLLIAFMSIVVTQSIGRRQKNKEAIESTIPISEVGFTFFVEQSRFGIDANLLAATRSWHPWHVKFYYFDPYDLLEEFISILNSLITHPKESDSQLEKVIEIVQKFKSNRERIHN